MEENITNEKEDRFLAEVDLLINDIALCGSDSTIESFARVLIAFKDARNDTQRRDYIDKCLSSVFRFHRDYDRALTAWESTLANQEVEYAA